MQMLFLDVQTQDALWTYIGHWVGDMTKILYHDMINFISW